MKTIDKLRVNWGKRERDLMFHFPLGFYTKSDAHYLHGVFTAEFIKEMDERGYDITTLKFEISPKVGDDKFSSQRSE